MQFSNIQIKHEYYICVPFFIICRLGMTYPVDLPRLYGRVHKLHHEFKAPHALAALYGGLFGHDL
jgi:hypothetical protein